MDEKLKAENLELINKLIEATKNDMIKWEFSETSQRMPSRKTFKTISDETIFTLKKSEIIVAIIPSSSSTKSYISYKLNLSDQKNPKKVTKKILCDDNSQLSKLYKIVEDKVTDIKSTMKAIDNL